jgi:hypothetical protein
VTLVGHATGHHGGARYHAPIPPLLNGQVQSILGRRDISQVVAAKEMGVGLTSLYCLTGGYGIGRDVLAKIERWVEANK